MQRIDHLSLTLDGCLNWQERCAGIVLDDPPLNKPVRRLVKDIASIGLTKKDFLFDALECCLSDPGCATLRERQLSRVALHTMIRDDATFFTARVFAKLFRALLSTRILQWSNGGPFHYDRDDEDLVFYPRPQATRSSPATTLAHKLKQHAVRLAAFIDALGEREEARIFRSAVSGRTPAHGGHWRALLQLWQTGRQRRLPVDKLWDRVAPCEFTNHCLDYDEFCQALIGPGNVAADSDGDAIGDRVAEKLDLLHRATERAQRTGYQETSGQWQRVSRNWLCRGFRRHIYRWDEGSTSARDSRGMVDLGREAEEVIDYIDDEDSPAYERPRRRMRGPLALLRRRRRAGEWSTAVRMATAGSSIEEIGEELEWPGGKSHLYEFFFLVATQRRGLKVQECWRALAG